jgi:serine/threonine-protein kinase
LDEALRIEEKERAAWLAPLREKDPVLASHLETLLREHQVLSQEHFLEQGPASLLPAHGSTAGQSIGPYTLVSLIGEGGMGSVWLAERNDGRFERQVAVKLLRAPLFGGAGGERFKREGAILARLVHPNVAQLLDAGVSPAGQPYLTLEYVQGENIVAYCDSHRLEVEARLRLFLDVLAAVAHAHANLIVHRDIKPSNVFVRTDGQVKLLDFGIAKLLEDEGAAGTATLLTLEGGGGLTPQFAAPEQVTGCPVTVATDVYASGVVLYVLLTGQHPFGPELRSPADLIKAIVETETLRPSDALDPAQHGMDTLVDTAVRRATTPDKLRRLLQGDLDTIVAKALKKNSLERYASATAFADDLRRYLAHEPISARPDTLAYRARKFVRRNRLAVALAALAFVAAVAGVVGTVIQARKASAQRDFALRQLARAEAINDLNSFLLSDAAPSGKPFTVSELLERAEHIVERQQDKRDAVRVEILMSIGRQYNAFDEQAKSRQLLEEAYDLSRGLTDPAVRARAACSLAVPLAFAGEHSRAAALAQEGLQELGNEPQFTLDRIYCSLRGGDVAEASGDVQKRLELAQTARRLFDQSPLKPDLLEAQLEIELAGAYSTVGRYSEASAAFAQASSRLTALGRDDTETAATLFNNWGLALYLAGQSLDAERVLRRAVEIFREGQSEEAVSPMLLVNYARVLSDLKRLSEAADYAERGYVKAQRVGAPVVISQCLLLRAAIYIDQGDLPRAAAMLDEVEPRLRKGLPSGHIAFGVLASERGLLIRAKGDRQTALKFFDEAVGVAERLSKDGKLGGDYLPIFLTRRSVAELELHHADRAQSDAARALSLLQPSLGSGTFSSKLGRAYLALGRALQMQGKRDEARGAFRSATEHLQNALGPDHPDTLATRQIASLETQGR